MGVTKRPPRMGFTKSLGHQVMHGRHRRWRWCSDSATWLLATRKKKISSAHEKLRGLIQCSKQNAYALSSYNSMQFWNQILCRDKGGMCPCFQQEKEGWFGLLPSPCVSTCLYPWWPQQTYLSTASEKKQPPGHSIPQWYALKPPFSNAIIPSSVMSHLLRWIFTF